MMRFPPKRIIVAFDRTSISVRAWKHAAALASRFGAATEIVYVKPFQTAVAGLDPLPGLTPVVARGIRTAIREMTEPRATIHVVEGDPARRILDMARRRRADLIVMGTHGRGTGMRFLMGSVAEEVISESPVPVLVARGPVKAVESILAPVNFTSYSNHGFAYALEAANEFGADVTALYVSGDPVWDCNPLLRLRRVIEELPPSRGARCEPRVVRAENTPRAILRAAARHDLIVLTAHKKSPVEEIFLGTTAARVLRASKKPVLVVPPPRHIARGAAFVASARRRRTF